MTAWIGLLVLVLIVVAAVKFGPALMLRLAIGGQRRAAGLAAKSVAVEGREMVYLDGGSGEPLVLIHGFGAEKDNWTPIARHLSDRFRVIAPDLPPFGESAGWPGAHYTVEAQVERLKGFVTALGLPRFHLGGNSMGGAIAGAYAARYPEDLLALWLLAPAGVDSADESELEARLERGDNPLLVSNADEFRAVMDFAMEKPPYIPAVLVRHLAALAVQRRPIYEAVFDALTQEREGGRPPLETALAGSDVPTLITWGDRDRLLHVSGAKVLADAMKRAEVQVLEGIGHVPMIERPEECASAWRGFLDRQRR